MTPHTPTQPPDRQRPRASARTCQHTQLHATALPRPFRHATQVPPAEHRSTHVHHMICASARVTKCVAARSSSCASPRLHYCAVAYLRSRASAPVRICASAHLAPIEGRS